MNNPYAKYVKHPDSDNPYAKYIKNGQGGSGDAGKVSELESLASGAADAFSLGWGDEALGLGAGIGAFLTGGDFGKAWEDTTAWSRAQQSMAQHNNPLLYGTGQVLGGIGGGLATGGLGRLALGGLGAAAGAANIGSKVGALGRIGAAAGVGAVGGAAYGAGSATDDKLAGALEGGATGAIFGGGLRALGEPLGAAYRNVVKPAFDANYRGARMMAKAFDRHGGGNAAQKIVDNLDRAAPGAIAMDVVPGGAQITMGAATRPSAGKEAMRKVLDDRNNNMGDDAANDLWTTILGRGSRVDAGMRIHDLKAAQRGIDYADIDAMQIKPTIMAKDFVYHHLKQPNTAFKGAIQDAIEAVKVDNPNVVGLRIVGDQINMGDMINHPKFWRSLWTNVREDIRAQERAAMFNGEGLSKLRGLKADASNLRKELGGILGPKWEAKQASYKALADEEDALRMGYDAVAKSGDIKLGDALSEIGRKRDRFRTPEAKDQFDEWVKKGALAHVEDMMNRADTGSGRADVLRSIIGNRSKITTLNQLLGRATKSGAVDQRTGFAKVLKRMEAQRELFDNSVKSGIGVNSHTADKLSAQASQLAQTNPSAGGIRGALLKAVTGDASDEFDEKVSNKVLEFMQKPAAELKREIAAAGGVNQWIKSLGKNDLMALALASQKPAWRQKALNQAITGGLYANAQGDALLEGFGLGTGA